MNDFQELFQQGSSQLNFLLLSQRNIILIFALSLTFAAFSASFKYRYLIRFIMFTFLVYAFAVGIVSVINYNNYMRRTKNELDQREQDDQNVIDERDVLNEWSRWVYFSYVLLGINALIIIFYIVYEAGIYHQLPKTRRVFPKTKKVSQSKRL